MQLNALRKKAILSMVLLDYIAAVAAWLVFWIYRQKSLHALSPEYFPANRPFLLRDYLIALLAIPGIWLFLYYLSGTYFDLYRKSRLHEIYRSLLISLIGALGIGVVTFANDTGSFSYFFEVTTWYCFTHVTFLLLARLILLYKIKMDLLSGRVGYNTLIVGGNGKAEKVYREIKNNPKVLGNNIIGFVSVDENPPKGLDHLQELGGLEELEDIIDREEIEEVVIAVESHEHQKLEHLLTRLSYRPVIVKVLPDLYDIISGSVKTSSVYAPLLISIHPELLSDWQKVIKRVMDVSVSVSALILLSPLYLFSAWKVKRSSPGPVFYKQQRIGLFGRPFHIYKFRSMYTDAEARGPSLSSDDDPRITGWGKVMRKWRIDELPQFLNILKGEMSLVGPRPERKFYIDQIVKTHPVYKYLHRVKPGLTSWGMVQYGYAENIEQMIERMRYDLLYIENCSLALDLKIMLYTLQVILQGRGK